MKFTKKDLLTLYTNLVRTRAFDELFTRRRWQGKLLGSYDPSIWEEAPGVGGCTFLEKDDVIWPHHRGHGLPHMISKGIDPKYFLAEHTGKLTGTCGGMSTYHGFDANNGLLGYAGLIGSCFPISVGYGLAAKKNADGQVVACFFGDGGSNRGTLHEAFLMANNWDLPIVYVCENNSASQFEPFEKLFPFKNVADLAQGYGMPSDVVDGQDVIAVAETVMTAVERARKGKGPSLIECKTCRYYVDFVNGPDMFSCEYLSAEEKEELKKRDPIDICRNKLMARRVLTKKEVERIDNEVALEIDAAEAFADEGPIPDPNTFDQLLYDS